MSNQRDFYENKCDINSYENAWLNLSSEEIKDLYNPFMDDEKWKDDELHYHVLSLMQNPRYLHWTAYNLLNINLLPQQVVILRELWTRPFPMYIASRGYGKSFLLAVYATLKCLLIPESKVVIVGSAFRQSKVIFEYMEQIWKNAPLMRSICSDSSGPRRDVDRCTMKINDSQAIAIPLGDGSKIRGLRAHTIIADEFNSIAIEIYETVVMGFASVSKDPADNVILSSQRNKMKKDNVWDEQYEEIYQSRSRNQSIIAGTAGYEFEPYCEYFKKYKTMIEKKGEKADDIEYSEFMENLNYQDFGIIRIPIEKIPEGFMDEPTIARAKATMHTGTFLMEYGASFAKDSQGFFKRTLIESCVASEQNIAKGLLPMWCDEVFDAVTFGRSDKEYIFGIDPASEVDNFAIVILELHKEHQRVVYTWTTNKKDFINRKRLGLTNVSDYYSFCIRKIRDLMLVFPCKMIGIDSQGGGHQIAEGLRDPDKLRRELGEEFIYPAIVEGKEQETDFLNGKHILELINFANQEWTSTSNNGLRKDLEDKVLLFPRFDKASLAIVSAQDEARFDKLKSIVGETEALKLYDTLEDCVMDIEELKNELATIIMTRTPTGKDKFDTPEIKLGVGKKGRMRKDRYSALLIANAIARTISRALPGPVYSVIGKSLTSTGKPTDRKTNMYSGWQSAYSPSCVKVVKKQ